MMGAHYSLTSGVLVMKKFLLLGAVLSLTACSGFETHEETQAWEEGHPPQRVDLTVQMDSSEDGFVEEPAAYEVPAAPATQDVAPVYADQPVTATVPPAQIQQTPLYPSYHPRLRGVETNKSVEVFPLD